MHVLTIEMAMGIQNEIKKTIHYMPKYKKYAISELALPLVVYYLA
jgi:hypothetical protein